MVELNKLATDPHHDMSNGTCYALLRDNRMHWPDDIDDEEQMEKEEEDEDDDQQENKEEDELEY